MIFHNVVPYHIRVCDSRSNRALKSHFQYALSSLFQNVSNFPVNLHCLPIHGLELCYNTLLYRSGSSLEMLIIQNWVYWRAKTGSHLWYWDSTQRCCRWSLGLLYSLYQDSLSYSLSFDLTRVSFPRALCFPLNFGIKSTFCHTVFNQQFLHFLHTNQLFTHHFSLLYLDCPLSTPSFYSNNVHLWEELIWDFHICILSL